MSALKFRKHFLRQDKMQLETHAEAVEFVQHIFRELGGRVIPPNRPRHIDKYAILTLDRDDFMMDFENSCLSQHWNSKPHPKGSKRYEDPEWAAMIESQVYPNHSDVDWNEYVDWVSRGFGDEWFRDASSMTIANGCDDSTPRNRPIRASRTPSPPPISCYLNGRS